MHENGMTIFLLNKEFFALSRCIFCDRAVQDTVSKRVAIELFWMNVKILNFNTGEQIVDLGYLEKI